MELAIIITTILIIIGFFSTKRYYDEMGYDKNGYNKRYFNKHKYHMNGTKFDGNGFDFDGFHKTTHQHLNGTLYNYEGFDYSGYDKNGYDELGFDKNGYDKNGYNEQGYNEYGYDKDGYGKDGYNKDGYNKRCFKKNGHHKNNTQYDEDGFDFYGFHMTTYQHINGSLYDDRGINYFGYDRQGYDEKGYDKEGKNRQNEPWWLSSNITLLKSDHFSKFFSIELKDVKDKEKTKLNILINNAYNVLGIQPSSGTKEINKRVLDLIKLATVNICQEYDFEVFRIEIQRNEKSIKEASMKLLDPKKRIFEMFFWFDFDIDYIRVFILNRTIEEALHLLYKDYYLHKNIFSLKNALLLSALYSTVTLDSNPIIKTLSNWKIVIDSEQYFDYFLIKFNSTNDWTIKDDIYNNFKKNIVNILSDFFYLVSKEIDDLNINTDFFRTFNIASKAFYQEQVIPKLAEVSNEVENFGNGNIDFKKGRLNADSKDSIDKLIQLIEAIYKQIDKFQYLNTVDCKQNFEKAAQTIRSVAIEVLNNIDENSKGDNNYAKNLLEIAKKYATSEVLKKRINDDFNDIQNSEKKNGLIEGIAEQIKKNKYDSARSMINQLKELDDGYQNLEMCRTLYIISFKNEYTEMFKNAIQKANRIAENAGYWNGFSTKKQFVDQLTIAVKALNMLMEIVDKEGNWEEKQSIEKQRNQLISQILQVNGRW